MSKNYLLILLVTLSLGIALQADARKAGHACGKNEEECLNNPDCLCWCAFKPGLRRKTAADSPVFVKNDPLGHYCYCQQRDLDKARVDER